MSDQNINSHYADLISKYLSGNTSTTEVEELENWVLADPLNKQQFMQMKQTWMLSGMGIEQQKVDVESLWSQTAEKLFPTTKVIQMGEERSRNRQRWLSIAAAVAVLAAISLWVFSPGNDEAFIAETSTEAQEFKLEDGSKVILNQASSLSFVADKKEVQRNVELAGDAFFDVAEDANRPFVIQTENIQIEVLGTSFYVDARKDQQEIQVIVESGTVAVRANGQETILNANEQAIFTKSTAQLNKQQNQDANFRHLKTQALVFDNTPLEEVVFALNRKFGSEVYLANEALKACPLDGKYEQKSLASVLTIIEATLTGLEIEKEDQGYAIKGNCDQ